METEIKFSIVFPTRERITLLDNLLQSIHRNTFNTEEIEVLIAVDEDDTVTQNYLLQCPFNYVKMFIVKRSLNFSRDYYSYLAGQGTGKWIITANDDCMFETKDWDVIAYDVLKNESNIIYGWIEDGIEGFRAKGHGHYCCFPLQGRGGFEALGFIFPPRIPTWGADIWAKALYDSVDQVLDVPIVIRHYCHHNNTREQDHISKRIMNNQVAFDMRPTYEETNCLLRALREEVVCDKRHSF